MSDVDDGYGEEIDDGEGTRPVRHELTPAQRRARRQTITLLLVSGLLLVGFLFAAAYYEGWFSDEKAPVAGPTCEAPTTTIKPSQVKLNVYNASNRTGLAKRVAGEMKDRGFSIGKIDNDPLHQKFTEPAVVRYGAKGKSAARLVASEVSGGKLVEDKRKDATVDLVLGAQYSTLIAQNDTPTATCSPTATSTSSGPAKPTKKTTHAPSGSTKK